MLKILDDLKWEVHSTLERAIKLEKKYRRTGKRLKKEAYLRLCETLRNSLAQDIGAITKGINDKVAAKEGEFRSFPYLYEDKEIWIYVRRHLINERLYFSFYVSEMGKEHARDLAVRLENEGKFRCARVDEYRKRVVTLKSAIIKGSFDEMYSNLLKMKGEEVLWEIMGYSGELLPHLPKRTTD